MKPIPHKSRKVNSKFRALTSLILEQYKIIEPIFHDLMEAKILITTLKGHRRAGQSLLTKSLTLVEIFLFRGSLLNKKK